VLIDDVANASAVRNDNTLTKGAGEDASCDSIVHCATCNISTVRHVHCTMCKKTFQALVGLTKHIRQKHNGEHTCNFLCLYQVLRLISFYGVKYAVLLSD